MNKKFVGFIMLKNFWSSKYIINKHKLAEYKMCNEFHHAQIFIARLSVFNDWVAVISNCFPLFNNHGKQCLIGKGNKPMSFAHSWYTKISLKLYFILKNIKWSNW